MTYAVVHPQKIPIELMIPPINQSDVPVELRMAQTTPLMLKQAKANFEVQAQDAFYAEWLWCYSKYSHRMQP